MAISKDMMMMMMMMIRDDVWELKCDFLGGFEMADEILRKHVQKRLLQDQSITLMEW